ncbi:DUF4177 domain-containing protein [Roseibacterium sp. SDUM158017]|uniref:DUF4177 domain-containing protein n=1 Tax=Roseicyclus salinarum TaxID=3036773 RepID=UPI0024158458|nr:DUF4177 domain-containing protein [Roseibacterium sp. SDUM158017]MDG4648090.1 DUF4177 domain-containing protein [Roseibacterium sp. SDUM158017]
MPFYEYKVVPAPERLPKVRALKGPARFAHALETLMNELAQDGWEYLRAETLPEEERKGLTGRIEVTRNILVFRRELYFEETGDAGSHQATAAPETPPAAAPGPGPIRAETPAPAPAQNFERRPLFADRRAPDEDA